ncbi:MAG: STAS domain-containing protein [Solirubrobacterales bacterium]
MDQQPWRSTPGPPPPEFGVSSRDVGEVIFVELRGEVDLVSADVVREALGSALERSPALVVADLTRVDLLDSTGLGALIGAANSAGEECRFAILAPGGMHVRGVLSLSGVLDQLTVFESVEEVEDFRPLA